MNNNFCIRTLDKGLLVAGTACPKSECEYLQNNSADSVNSVDSDNLGHTHNIVVETDMEHEFVRLSMCRGGGQSTSESKFVCLKHSV
jgi:hypothetical protein